MAKKNYAQYILLVAVAVFIIVGITNYGATPSGSYAEEQSDRFDVREYVCEWGEGSDRVSGGFHWIGETYDHTWTLGSSLTSTGAYCNDPAWTWTCKHPITGRSIIDSSGTANCNSETEWSVCFCRR